MYDTKSLEIPIEISFKLLSDEALAGIIESFILREGTDYGIAEASYEQKVKQIRRQIEKSEIKVVFDQNSQTVSLVNDNDLKKWNLERVDSADSLRAEPGTI
jgi:uncharacterized protein YheU (UPF0270 family)